MAPAVEEAPVATSADLAQAAEPVQTGEGVSQPEAVSEAPPEGEAASEPAPESADDGNSRRDGGRRDDGGEQAAPEEPAAPVATEAVPVPEEAYTCPLDQVRVARPGTDVTITGVGVTVHRALEAAERLAEDGVNAEVLDLVSLAPLDRVGIRRSVAKTGRLLAVDDDYLSYGVSGEVLASACEDRSVRWRATPARISYPDVPVPFSPALEHPLLPDAEGIAAAVHEMLGVPA